MKQFSWLMLFCLFKVNCIFSMDTTPNEIVRMFFEHMTHTQRKGIARVSKIWNFLSNTFPAPKVVIVNTQKQKEQLTQYENIPIMTANEFAQAKNNNCPDKVILPYPLDDSSLLCDEKIERIRFDIYRNPDQNRIDEWRKLDYNYFAPKEMFQKLKKKTGDWSLCIYYNDLDNAPYHTKTLFASCPYLKKINFKACCKKHLPDASYEIKILRAPNIIENRTIRDEGYYNIHDEYFYKRFKYEEAKTPMHDSIDTIEKIVQKNTNFNHIELETDTVQISELKRLLALFESSKNLNMIICSCKDWNNNPKELDAVIKNAVNISIDIGNNLSPYYILERKQQTD